MGYTHHWCHGPIPADAWTALVDDARRIIAAAKVALAGGDGTGEPVLDAGEIFLNGAAPDDFETFLLEAKAPGRKDFCKTGMRPYDLVVTAILLRATLTIPGFLVKSNGTWAEWRPTRDLYATLFGPAPDASPLVSSLDDTTGNSR